MMMNADDTEDDDSHEGCDDGDPNPGAGAAEDDDSDDG